jgi:hypothetical protein
VSKKISGPGARNAAPRFTFCQWDSRHRSVKKLAFHPPLLLMVSLSYQWSVFQGHPHPSDDNRMLAQLFLPTLLCSALEAGC